MDKIFNFGEVMELSVGPFNLTLLVPVVLVVGTVVGIFLFGFRKPKNPRFPKNADSHSNSSGGGSRSKRKPRSNEPAGGKSPKSPKQVVHREKLEQQAQHVKTVKKETTPPKATAAPVKKTPTDSAAAKKQTAAKQKSATPAATKDGPKSKAALKVEAKAAKAEAKAAKAKAIKLNPVDNSDGEWQTVITKKHKKQADPLIQAVSEVAASVTAKKEKQSSTVASPPKKKEAKVNVPDVAVEAVEINISAPPVVEAVHTEATPVAIVAPLTPPASPGVRAVVTATVEPIEVIEAVPETAPETTLVFDELGDAAWTENKPQRKNRRRALRE